MFQLNQTIADNNISDMPDYWHNDLIDITHECFEILHNLKYEL